MSTYDPRYWVNNKVAITARRVARRAANHEAILLREKAYRASRPQAIRATWLMDQYGLTVERWNAMLKAQGGVCAICKSPDPGSKRGWHTDADHARYKVRGLLCRSCNTGLGKFKHDYALMRAAANYLKKHSGE